MITKYTGKSSILTHLKETNAKEKFDAGNTKHLEEYRFFIKNQRWKDRCPFQLEWPFVSVVALMERKIIDHYIDDLISKK